MNRHSTLPFDVDTSLASKLIRSRFPRWAGLPVRPVASPGTANRLFRLGADMVIRFPRTRAAIEAIGKEMNWLPELSAYFSLQVPEPLDTVEPQDEYPWPWSVYRWLEGEDLWSYPLIDLRQAAETLARFVSELQGIDTGGGPAPGRHNSFRGAPLADRDHLVRRAIRECGNRIDPEAVTREWEIALAQPCSEQGCWTHGDLQPGNLIARNGGIVAVIDFGLLCVGDPAVDLLPAWNLLDRESRQVFRKALQVDEATWSRGRGWAICQSVLALPYYWNRNGIMVDMANRQLGEICPDG